jgi:hypothetical protein
MISEQFTLLAFRRISLVTTSSSNSVQLLPRGLSLYERLFALNPEKASTHDIHSAP